MVSREIWGKHALMSFSKTQIELVLRTRAILYVFEKLTRACFPKLHSKPYYYLYEYFLKFCLYYAIGALTDLRTCRFTCQIYCIYTCIDLCLIFLGSVISFAYFYSLIFLFEIGCRPFLSLNISENR